MKIAYFNASLKKGQDGVTRVIYKMIEGASERGHESIAVTSALPDPQDRVIPMYKVPSLVFPLHKAYRIAIPGYRAFARTLDSFDPDIIHINSPCPLGFAAAKYGHRSGIPVVATYHTHFPTYPRYYKMRGLEEFAWKILRTFYREIDRTFVPTQPILRELTDHGIERLQYLPNGVDSNLFNPAQRSDAWRKNYGPNNAMPIVLFVSRLVWEKDLKTLAEMYKRLRSRRMDFSMVVVGDGHARAELERMMPGAHFLGYRSGVDLARCYASSDIFVFPSTTETFGLVTVEAMASGAVPIAANVGGATGIIDDGISGHLVRPLDAAEMAKRVEDLLDCPEELKRLSKGAVRRSMDFRWTYVLDELFKSYEEVIDEYRNYKRHKAA